MTTTNAPHRRTYVIDDIRTAFADALERHPFAPDDTAIDITIAPTPTPQGVAMFAYLMMSAPSPILGQRTLNIVAVPLEAVLGGHIDPLVDEIVKGYTANIRNTLATTPPPAAGGLITP